MSNNNTMPRLSTEEWIQKKQQERDSAFAQIDETAKEVVSDPDKFQSYLDAQSRLNRYSAVNTLLIFSQKPDATQLKTFGDWGEKGVRINKGEKGLNILEPREYTREDGTIATGFDVKKVFDVSQTSGAKRQPAPSVNRDPQKLIAIMLDTAPVEVESTNEIPFPDMAAYYNNADQTLYVKRDTGDSVTLFQSVAQELGHAQLAINADAYSRDESSFKAACIGYMLCKKFGVDAQSFNIREIPDSLKEADTKTVRNELSKMRNSMSQIHGRVSDELYRQRQERAKDNER